MLTAHVVSLSVNIIKGLKHSLRKGESSKDYEYMKDLMTRAHDVKLSSKPPLRHLVES